MERTKALKHFIPSIEKAFIGQDEFGQIEIGGSAARTASFRHEIDGRVIHRVEDRFSVVAERVHRPVSKFRRRGIDLVEVDPHTLEEKLWPNQQDLLWYECPKDAEPRIPEPPADLKYPRSRWQFTGAGHSFQTSHSLAAGTAPSAESKRGRLQLIEAVDWLHRLDKVVVRGLKELPILLPFASQTPREIADSSILMIENRCRS
jgi:hypothetical protein